MDDRLHLQWALEDPVIMDAAHRSIQTPTPLVLALILGLTVAACGSGSKQPSNPSATTATSAKPTASDAAAHAPIPSELRSRWMGGHRDVAGVQPLAGTSIVISEDDFALTQSAESGDRHLLGSSAALVADGRIRLELAADDEACAKGDVGLYSWTLSPSGRTLTVSGGEDNCSTRLAATRGVWWRMACRDPHGIHCLGDLDAGTYASQYVAPRLDPGADWQPVFGGVTYTVPEGWANSADWPNRLNLVPAAEFANVTPEQQEVDAEVLLFTQPVALRQGAPCFTGEPDPDVGRTVDDLVAWLGRVPGLETTEPVGIEIDGHPGRRVDLTVDPDQTSKCEELEFMKASDGDVVAIAGKERERLLLLDLGQGDVAGIRIFSRDPADFESFVEEAVPVIESFQFK